VHMLRHACGYALANQGHDTRAIQDWLGHRAIQHTTRYTELSQERFKDFWRQKVRCPLFGTFMIAGKAVARLRRI
jgi:site-specific recombinase XerD